MHRGSFVRAQIGPGVVFGALVHRAKLVDLERVPVEAHALLGVEDGTCRRSSNQGGDDEQRDAEHDQGHARDGDVDRTLEQTVEAAKRHVVQADDRNAVEVLQARAQRDELEEVWDDVDVDALATGLLDQAEHLHVLLERERDIQVIDALLPDDVAAFGERAEQRQSSIADVVARGPVVEKADDLEAELAVLEQLVRDEPAQIARAGNQHALEPDAGTPPALECLTHELARGVGEDDVDGQEQQPDRAGDLVDALRLRVERDMRRVVDLVGTACR